MNTLRYSRLRVAYPVPDPCDTLESWVVFTHRDLAGLTYAQLQGERAQLRALLLLGRVHPWHRERLRRIEEVLRRAS